jgi:AcrR family transcriptional regulator
MKDKRTSILKTAEHDFLERGYNGTSIDSIVREVGGSKSTVYSHFKDKRVLFAAALADVQSELDFTLTRSQSEPVESVHQRLILMGIELLSLLLSKRALHLLRTLVAESWQFPEVGRQFVQDGLDVATAQIALAIDAGMTTGEFVNADSHELASCYVGLLTRDFLIRSLLGVGEPPSSDELAERAENSIQVVQKSIVQ